MKTNKQKQMDGCMVQGDFLALAENSVNIKKLTFETTVGLSRTPVMSRGGREED